MARLPAPREVIALLRTYAEQGKDPPADILRLVTAGDGRSDGFMSERDCRHGKYCDWRRAAFFASLTIGFGMAAYLTGDFASRDGFFVAAIVMACLACAFSLLALLSPRADPHG